MTSDSRVQDEQGISARWRTLTHSHLFQSPSRDITQHVADALWITGSFPSIQHSLDFVKAKASSEIETIDKLARRLESAFMVDIKSSDMYLLFETPLTVFDKMRVKKEFRSNGREARQGRDKVAGTTRVGVWKTVGGRQGEGRRTEVLLKARVVLERDLIDLEETESATSCVLV